MPAGSAKENRLAWSIPLVDRSAARARFARVARIDRNNLDANALGFVFQKSAKLAERPIGQAIATAAASRNPSANVLQFFQSNSTSGAFSVSHNVL